MKCHTKDYSKPIKPDEIYSKYEDPQLAKHLKEYCKLVDETSKFLLLLTIKVVIMTYLNVIKNFFVKIFRFFFPKGGFTKNFYAGQEIGKQLAKDKYKQLESKKKNKQNTKKK